MPVQRAQPYLFFNGYCAEALAYYEKVLGARIGQVMKFKDNPSQPPPSKVSRAFDNKIMHASFRIGETEVLVSDGMKLGKPNFRGCALTLSVKTEKEADKIFNALKRSGHVLMPIGKTFFSPRFGVVADKFGMSWMVIVE